MAEYIEYHPLKFWLDPASIAEIVAHIQTYLVNNPINSTTEIETIIHDYLIAHPELIGGVESVNGQTGAVVLTADNISGGENVTIKDVLDSLQDQIDDIVASIPSDYQQLVNDVSDLKSALLQSDSKIESSYYDSLPIVNASFTSAGAYSSTNTKRIATEFIPVKHGDKIVIINGSMKHACGAWVGERSSGTNVRNDGSFSTSNETIISQFDGWYVVVFAKIDATQAVTPSEFDGHVYVYANNIYRNGTKIENIESELVPLNGKKIIDPSDFDIGSITISNSGWEYSSSNSRVRTKENVTIPLHRGDIIGLTNYTNARFAIGWQRSDNTYGSATWRTSDFTVQEDGNYVIIIGNLTDINQHGIIYALLDLLKIIYADNTSTKADKLTAVLNKSITPLLEVGNVDASASGWTYSYNINRARTPFGTQLHLNNGDIISLSDYATYRFYVSWKKPDGTYKWKGWNTSDFYVEEEGLYIILLSTVSNTAPVSMKAMMDSLSVFHLYGADDIIHTDKDANQLLEFVKSVNHRGYNLVAPENTLPAYKLSKEHGFAYVETDVAFTSDNVPVLLHDASINRTARNADGTTISGTVNIYDITYEQALAYDFGIWKGSAYEGTKIPTLEQFLALCKRLDLHPYIELKTDGSYTQAQILSAFNVVNAYGMKDKVTFISFSDTYLGYIKSAYPKARLGYLCNTITEGVITAASGLKTNDNDVFINAAYSYITSETIALAINAGLPVETWTINNTEYYSTLNPYITGVSSDELLASVVINTLVGD